MGVIDYQGQCAAGEKWKTWHKDIKEIFMVIYNSFIYF